MLKTPLISRHQGGRLVGSPAASIEHGPQASVDAFSLDRPTTYADLTSRDRTRAVRLHPYFPATLHNKEVAHLEVSKNYVARASGLVQERFGFTAHSSHKLPDDWVISLATIEQAFGDLKSASLTQALINNPSLHHSVYTRSESKKFFLEILESLGIYLFMMGVPLEGIQSDPFLQQWFDPKDKRGNPFTREMHSSRRKAVAPINGHVKEFREQVLAFWAYDDFIAFPNIKVLNQSSIQGHQRYWTNPDGFFTVVKNGVRYPTLFEVKSFHDDRANPLSKSAFRTNLIGNARGNIITQFLRTAHMMLDPANTKLRFRLHLVSDGSFGQDDVLKKLRKGLVKESEYAQKKGRNTFLRHNHKPIVFSTSEIDDVMSRVSVTRANCDMDLSHLAR